MASSLINARNKERKLTWDNMGSSVGDSIQTYCSRMMGDMFVIVGLSVRFLFLEDAGSLTCRNDRT